MNIYKSKYLKYKKKYLSYKNQIGGIETATRGECHNFCLWCGDPSEEYIKLDCGCCLHRHCLLEYIRSQLGDKGNFKKVERGTNIIIGIKCPFSSNCIKGADKCENENIIITPERLTEFLRSPISQEDITRLLSETSIEGSGKKNIFDLSDYELQRFYRFANPKLMDVSTDEPSVIDYKSEYLSQKMNYGTTKQCPHIKSDGVQCSTRESHFHGHECHHAKYGCQLCKTEYCWVCLSTAEENRRYRGREDKCKCPNYSWSSFCNPIKSIDDITFNINGYPIDSRCGCPICNECSIDIPCPTCDGNCYVCKGLVPKGPNGIDEVDEWFHDFLVMLEKRNLDEDEDEYENDYTYNPPPDYGYTKVLEQTYDDNGFDINSGIHIITKTQYDENDFDKDGFHFKTGSLYNKAGFDRNGIYEFTNTPYDMYGFNRNGINKITDTQYDEYDFDINGIHLYTNSPYNTYDFDRNGFNIDGINIHTLTEFDNYGFDKNGINNITKTKLDYNNFNRNRINIITKTLYNENNFDIDGRHINGTFLDENNYNRYGFSLTTFYQNVAFVDFEGYNYYNFNKEYHRNGTLYDEYGFNYKKIHKNGTPYDNNGYDINGFKPNGDHRNDTKYDKYGYDINRFNIEGEHINGTPYGTGKYNKNGFNIEGLHKTDTPFDYYGFDKNGIHSITHSIIDRKGFNREGLHHITTSIYGLDDYDRYGFNKEGFYKNTPSRLDEYGFDQNGIHSITHTIYDTSNFNRLGFTAGSNRYDTYTKLNRDGFDKDGYYNKTVSKYDKNGFNKDGFNKDGVHFTTITFDNKLLGFNRYNIYTSGKIVAETSTSPKGMITEISTSSSTEISTSSSKVSILDLSTNIDDEYNVSGFNSLQIHRNGTLYDDQGYNFHGKDKNGFDKYGYYGNGNKFNRDGFDKDENFVGLDGRKRRPWLKFDDRGYNINGFKAISNIKNENDKKNILTRTFYDRSQFDIYGFDVNGNHRNGTKYDDTDLDKDRNPRV